MPPFWGRSSSRSQARNSAIGQLPKKTASLSDLTSPSSIQVAKFLAMARDVRSDKTRLTFQLIKRVDVVMTIGHLCTLASWTITRTKNGALSGVPFESQSDILYAAQMRILRNASAVGFVTASRRQDGEDDENCEDAAAARESQTHSRLNSLPWSTRRVAVAYFDRSNRRKLSRRLFTGASRRLAGTNSYVSE